MGGTATGLIREAQARRQAGQVRRAPRFPRWPLLGMVGVVAFAFAATVFGQATGIGTVKLQTTKPAAVRDIVLTQGEDGFVRVFDAGTGDELASYGAGEGGFVRGSLRALDRMRLASQAPKDAPYRLIRWEKGTISLSDTVTGERLYLDAFGPDNAAAFGAFLEGHGEMATEEN